MDTLSESDTSFNDSLNKSKKRSIRSDKWEKSRRKGNRTDFRDRIARSSGGELATVFDIFGRILNMLSGLQEMMFATFVLNVKLRTDPNDNCKSSFHDHLEKVVEYRGCRKKYISQNIKKLHTIATLNDDSKFT
ncbi:uncharacterized protein LOC143151611 isoform X2 [Ptiloglossa arizonensis]|uniref:uncharacterized protein LOC143151611 isoform X2 n=1 Tax=Ptiloglossa arizonensis TaxID=3350558 RepID=UPI003FA05F1F